MSSQYTHIRSGDKNLAGLFGLAGLSCELIICNLPFRLSSIQTLKSHSGSRSDFTQAAAAHCHENGAKCPLLRPLVSFIRKPNTERTLLVARASATRLLTGCKLLSMTSGSPGTVRLGMPSTA